MFVDTKKYERRFVIGDVHGCSRTLKKLIEKINLNERDILFFVGDYIDRGPDSAGVLDYLLEIRKKYNVFFLRGNHEQYILDAFKEYESETFELYVRLLMKSNNLLDDNLKIKKSYLDFLKATEILFETEDFYIIHAGFNFSSENFLSDKVSILNLRYWDFEDLSLTNGKRVVHGHEPTPLEEIIRRSKNKCARLPIDNGCAFTKKRKHIDINKLQHLCCLNLDTYEVICQKNIEET